MESLAVESVASVASAVENPDVGAGGGGQAVLAVAALEERHRAAGLQDELVVSGAAAEGLDSLEGKTTCGLAAARATDRPLGCRSWAGQGVGAISAQKADGKRGAGGEIGQGKGIITTKAIDKNRCDRISQLQIHPAQLIEAVLDLAYLKALIPDPEIVVAGRCAAEHQRMKTGTGRQRIGATKKLLDS